FGGARTVADQTAGVGELAPIVDRRQRVARHQCNEITPSVGEERAGGDEQGAYLPFGERGEGGVEVAFAGGCEQDELPPVGARRRLRVADLRPGIWKAQVYQHGDHGRLGHKVAQQPELLCRLRTQQAVYAGSIAAWSVETGDEADPDRVIPDPSGFPGKRP